MNSIIETHYPISFREEDAKILGGHIRNRESVVLIGMKRVGISNFLRFFLNHKEIAKTYIDHRNHLFIPVDLNDLVEREIFPFWTLTMKRIVDKVNSSDFHIKIKKEVEQLFLSSIQSGDLFLTIDAVRKSLTMLVDEGVVPTLFFLRFDRIKDALTADFISNLEGLQEAMPHKLSYVFTSFRGLDYLAPSVFTKAYLSAFAQSMYFKSAKRRDTEIIFTTYKGRYKIFLPTQLKEALFELVDGYVQYLQLSLILLQEHSQRPRSKEELFNLLTKDERINFQSEELWESLNEKEKSVLLAILSEKTIGESDRKAARYLWDTGVVVEEEKKHKLFSPLFERCVKDNKKRNIDAGGEEFTKKEHVLFSYLKERLDEICEREKIIEIVWPEVEALGVSDWAVDRLVARVRSKLKLQKSQFEIQTVKTRGYKLIKK